MYATSVNEITILAVSFDFIWIDWQTANEGRPRPEELIGNAMTNTEEKMTHIHTNKTAQKKTCQTVRSY